MLPRPTGLGTSQAEDDTQHVVLPSSVEAAPALPPLQIPVLYAGEYQKTECQLAERNAIAFDLAFGEAACAPNINPRCSTFCKAVSSPQTPFR